MAKPRKLRLVHSSSGLEEARTELDDTIEDLFYIVKLYTAAGDRTMAQAVARHAHGLSALRLHNKS